ncbi:MAG: CpsB/CapC family capsule biosynthesis tyrosine phosphatase [Ginsengibacter sp.]
MFNFLKKNIPFQSIDLKNICQDIHSHILPGIDDGSPDTETSLKLIKGLYDLGITKMVATPHIIGDIYRNTPEIINDGLQKLKIACSQAGLNVQLSAAAEYMLDDYFMELLRKKEPLLTVTKNIILTELSYATAPGNLEEISFAILTGGYQPIMAHPERYFYYHKNYENFYYLKELGFLLQVNLLSLTGYYGSAVTKAAKFILQKDLADLVGTDIHSDRHLAALSKQNNLLIFQKFLGDKMYNDFETIA